MGSRLIGFWQEAGSLRIKATAGRVVMATDRGIYAFVLELDDEDKQAGGDTCEPWRISW